MEDIVCCCFVVLKLGIVNQTVQAHKNKNMGTQGPGDQTPLAFLSIIGKESLSAGLSAT
jgi:hypothetical protein